MAIKLKPNSKSFKKTFCVFQEVNIELINNLLPDFESESGSKYFYNDLGMFRLSNHWGRLANSKWHLRGNISENEAKLKLGFAKFENFYKDNDVDELYYLEYNPSLETINYNHKKNPDCDLKAVLRTTLETKKRIKITRGILNLSNWAKYYKTDIETLRSQIINELIYTNKTLDEIKRNLI